MINCYSSPTELCLEPNICTSLQAISREGDNEKICTSEYEGLDEQLDLKVTASDCLVIESKTCSQHYSELWQSVQYKHITGSISGRVLCQKKKTDVLFVP